MDLSVVDNCNACDLEVGDMFSYDGGDYLVKGFEESYGPIITIKVEVLSENDDHRYLEIDETEVVDLLIYS